MAQQSFSASLSARRPSSLLRLWLYGREGKFLRLCEAERWQALEALVDKAVQPPLHWLAALIDLGPPAEGDRRASALRRRVAIALVRLAASGAPASEKLQVALARAISVALPVQLSEPRVVPHLLSVAECAALVGEAERQAGWGSLHRQYPTTDLPISQLPDAERWRTLVTTRALPRFADFFGERYGLPLVFRNLFVAKYVAAGRAADAAAAVVATAPAAAPAAPARAGSGTRTPGEHLFLRTGAAPQPGLAGHVDESLLSMVLQLSTDSEFEGGGTSFETCRGWQVHKPGCGGGVFFLGKVFHSGIAITSGVRHVLVALVDRPDG